MRKQTQAKRLVFMEKEYLEIEETQVVCFGHPKNIYFMLNSSNIFHCVSPDRQKFFGLLSSALKKWDLLFTDIF